MGDWDDSEEEEEAAAATAAGNDPFGDEDESSDDGGAWDDSEEEAEDEPAKKKDAGPKKSAKELARAKRTKEQAARRLALKAERMELAIRAGRGAKTESASAAEPERSSSERCCMASTPMRPSRASFSTRSLPAQHSTPHSRAASAAICVRK